MAFRFLFSAAAVIAVWSATSAASAAERVAFEKGDKVLLIGNALAERENHFGRIEAALQAANPQKNLTIRNLGWNADTINLRLRSRDYSDHGHTLKDHDPDVILAFFGFNESFSGPEGLPQFKTDLNKFLQDLKALRYDYTTLKSSHEKNDSQSDKNGPTTDAKAVRIVLLSPIAAETTAGDAADANHLNQLNDNLQLYTNAMNEVAEQANVQFVDLYTPTQRLFKSSDASLTTNGVHLNDAGYAAVAPIVLSSLSGGADGTAAKKADANALLAAVLEKNQQHWYDYRAVNGYYIYGGRKNPFGVVNFPAEFEKLRKMIVNRDQRIWKIAAGEAVPETIDDSTTGDFVDVKSNVDGPIKLTTPEETAATFKMPEGFEAKLFASERDFPDLRNPCSIAFDAKGRLWVATMASYPMYLPGHPVDDKILILEDTDGDGKADKQTVFADGLYLPTGMELGDNGVYLAQQPHLVHLGDTDGDDHADTRTIVLSGFDSADSHHAISAFTWGPGGALYFQEGTFHHSQVETSHGPTRLVDAGVFRYEPKTDKLGVFVSYPFANPWGHTFDRWGQNFVADASPGANYYGTAFSGDIDFPRKHGTLKQFLVKQWRPTSGCEFVSSRNFPDEMQGDYLLNNVIGFHGVLQYRMREDGSGFAADPVTPLLRADDTNFRPVDLEFGPDGALYLCDWYNPLIGHMQHSVRDPNRDNMHGRIWRVWNTKKPLVKTPDFSEASIPELLSLLSTYEDRTRYRVRLELRERDTDAVMQAVDAWVAEQQPSDPQSAHNLLEALWVKQHHNVVDESLLTKLLNSDEPKARAAAVRVLCYQRDRVKEPLALLQERVNDENSRVRLEAVRALSFFDSQEALDISIESLVYDQDDYLEYALNETIATLENRIKSKQASGGKTVSK